MNLVVGATGTLGSEICRLLVAARQPVRALIRATADADKAARLERTGVTLVRGDLKDRASLDKACRGVNTVVSTASSTISRQAGDSIETVDRNGHVREVCEREHQTRADLTLAPLPAAGPAIAR
jgi:uncharacterized protein YbjT (DUF2867 family)